MIFSITRVARYFNAGKWACSMALGLVLGAGSTGCQTQAPAEFQQLDSKGKPISSANLLKDGDVLRIQFPGAPNLNTEKKIVDGKLVNLYLVGDVVAAGKSVDELANELAALYKPQVLSTAVNVTIISSTYSVFVSGAVLRPGEVVCDRPTTAAEAILKTGVDFAKANLKKVKVTRVVGGRYENRILDLRRVLHGEGDTQPYYLKPSDSIFVPEKFQWL